MTERVRACVAASRIAYRVSRIAYLAYRNETNDGLTVARSADRHAIPLRPFTSGRAPRARLRGRVAPAFCRVRLDARHVPTDY
ncbi:hypothetical protein WS64_12400 [Burkholderia anthina]|uniref:Uncharacterized protein n=1 Tax=Burkholderia anthina TaxID=179879 RepID=A0AAW3Q302_9BURK|nr:hypothetical protein WS64_12400 [Burkholderia anthina]